MAVVLARSPFMAKWVGLSRERGGMSNSALAIAETATLITVPGRSCENGRPAPVDREDYRRFASQLADAGLAAYKAAQSKNLDAMVEVSGTVSDACAACP